MSMRLFLIWSSSSLMRALCSESPSVLEVFVFHSSSWVLILLVQTSRVLWYLKRSSWTACWIICANLPRDSFDRIGGPQILMNWAQPYRPPGIAWMFCSMPSSSFLREPDEICLEISFYLVSAFWIDEHQTWSLSGVYCSLKWVKRNSLSWK